jgi:hypothetical protein
MKNTHVKNIVFADAALSTEFMLNARQYPMGATYLHKTSDK